MTKTYILKDGCNKNLGQREIQLKKPIWIWSLFFDAMAPGGKAKQSSFLLY